MNTDVSTPPPPPHTPLTTSGSIRSILAVSVSGIGNTILATPLLRALRQHIPGARIDLLVWSRAAGAPVEGSGWVDRVLVAPRQFEAWWRLMLSLRASRYDLALTVFPSNKMAFHLFLFLTGARQRIAHAYRGGWRRGEWLLTGRVPAQVHLHDVEQNLTLLSLLDIPHDGAQRTPSFYITAEDHAWADAWIREQGLDDGCLIGMHPGAGAAVSLKHWQGDHKRWPKERFAEVAGRLAGARSCTVLLTGGPEENELKAFVQRESGSPKRVPCLSTTLPRTAALLARCRLMISNDSGLMHVAAAVGVPVLALFGPTQAGRTAPVGGHHRILRKEGPCRPCLKYPFESASSKITCECQGACLRDITTDEVFAAASQMLGEG